MNNLFKTGLIFCLSLAWIYSTRVVAFSGRANQNKTEPSSLVTSVPSARPEPPQIKLKGKRDTSHLQLPLDARQGTASDEVWVHKPDGGKQCAPGQEMPIEEGMNELKKLGVQVIESRKASDGAYRPQMCGMPTGKHNAYRIKRSELGKAISSGFSEATE